MRKKNKTKKSCNQCGNGLHGAGNGRYFCARLDCSNFALLQIPFEDLIEIPQKI